MASIVAGQLVLLFLTTVSLAGLFIHEALRRYRIPLPYEVAILCFGLILGLLLLADTGSEGVDLMQSVQLFASLNPNVVLFCFLPLLLFDSAFSINFHTLYTVAAPTFLLAGPGLLLITAFTSALIYGCFPYGWSFLTCLLLGSLLAATDPVSTVAILKQANAHHEISTIVEAESFFNDGVAYICYSLSLHLAMAAGGEVNRAPPGVLGSGGLNVGSEIGDLIRQSVGGPFFGWLFALVAVFLLGRVPHIMAVEVSATVTAAYLCYLLSTANVGASGILSLVVFGLFMGKWRNHGISPSVHRALSPVWHWLVFIANTVLFAIVGVIICRALFVSSGVQFRDFGYCILLYLVLQVTRIAAIVCLFPFSRLLGYSLSLSEVVMLCAAGLRGAVSLMLALLTSLEQGIPTGASSKMVFHTAGIVLLTNVVNGTSTMWLVHKLRLNEEALEDRLLQREVMRQLLRSADDELQRLKAERQSPSTPR